MSAAVGARHAVEAGALTNRVEQFALLRPQYAALTREHRIDWRRSVSNVGDLSNERSREIDVEDIVVAHEVDAGAVAGDRWS